MIDRSGQVWEISNDTVEMIAGVRTEGVVWKAFTIANSSLGKYEGMDGRTVEFTKHRVVVSESGVSVDLSEDHRIPWEESPDQYRRVV